MHQQDIAAEDARQEAIAKQMTNAQRRAQINGGDGSPGRIWLNTVGIHVINKGRICECNETMRARCNVEEIAHFCSEHINRCQNPDQKSIRLAGGPARNICQQ